MKGHSRTIILANQYICLALALANHFPSLPSTQVSELKAVMDSKNIGQAPPVQKAVKGDKGDGGETGPRGPSGGDVRMINCISEAYSKNENTR